jgi:hypothetical protein
LIKIIWATFWAIFFTSPSGHPDYLAHTKCKLISLIPSPIFLAAAQNLDETRFYEFMAGDKVQRKPEISS